MTDVLSHSSTHFNKSNKSFMLHPPMTDITECCMTFAQSRLSKEGVGWGGGKQIDELQCYGWINS